MAIPALRAALTFLCCSNLRYRSPGQPGTTRGVASVDPSSTTMTSVSKVVSAPSCANAESTASRSFSHLLYVGIMMLTSGASAMSARSACRSPLLRVTVKSADGTMRLNPGSHHTWRHQHASLEVLYDHV